MITRCPLFLSLLVFLFAIPAIIIAVATVNSSSKLSTLFQPCLSSAPESLIPDARENKELVQKTSARK